MALLRKSRNGVTNTIWTGFVDAMTALLLLLMFVLSIFMIVQFVLQETISGQDEELVSLSRQVNELSTALGLAQGNENRLQEELVLFQSTLDEANARAATQEREIDALLAANSEQSEELLELRTIIVSFEEQVASLIAQRKNLQGRNNQLLAEMDVLESARQTVISQNEAFQIALGKGSGGN